MDWRTIHRLASGRGAGVVSADITIQRCQRLSRIHFPRCQAAKAGAWRQRVCRAPSATLDNAVTIHPFRLPASAQPLLFRSVKLLFIGDVVGEPGRRAVKQIVPRLRKQFEIDVVIANGENSAGGSGITVATAADLFLAGVDIITSGDHLWDQKEVSALLQNEPRFLRPLNYPSGTPGQGSVVCRADGRPPVAIINVQGRTFMQPPLDNPFTTIRAEVARLRTQAQIIFVDMHAEATSEKIAIARMLDGQVSAVVGTHTHVQTADEQIFPGGTAFLCDAGFTGPHESVLGREIHPIVKRFLSSQPQRFEVATGRILLQGALIEVDAETGRALKIERISEPLVAGES